MWMRICVFALHRYLKRITRGGTLVPALGLPDYRIPIQLKIGSRVFDVGEIIVKGNQP